MKFISPLLNHNGKERGFKFMTQQEFEKKLKPEYLKGRSRREKKKLKREYKMSLNLPVNIVITKENIKNEGERQYLFSVKKEVEDNFVGGN